jgi:hypothetical protein
MVLAQRACVLTQTVPLTAAVVANLAEGVVSSGHRAPARGAVKHTTGRYQIFKVIQVGALWELARVASVLELPHYLKALPHTVLECLGALVR